jgi:hypothetical protein
MPGPCRGSILECLGMRMRDKEKARDGAGSTWLGRDAVQGKTWMEIFRCGDPAPGDGRDCSIMLSTRAQGRSGQQNMSMLSTSLEEFSYYRLDFLLLSD